MNRDRNRRSGFGSLIRMALLIIALFLIGSFILRMLGGQEDAQAPAGAGIDAAEAISAGGGVQSGWAITPNTEEAVQDQIAPEAREKFTRILGDGKDEVTILVYMCGTDLESKSAMGTNDLNEMLSADVGDNVNLLVYTGGCNRWRNNLISSSVNQIYQIQHGEIQCVVENDGRKAMVDPKTLESFITWGAKNYPANRMALILWDHGTGSVTGYGYDEKYSQQGSMTLQGIDTALDGAGVRFDFVGFDACLMATAETGVMLGDHADYMIASEETEPGVGWYYTDWLNAVSANTSIPTLDLGKVIVDSFVQACRKQTPGQVTTLSVVDLAEFSQTFPPAMNRFSAGMTDLMSNGRYAQVSKARSMSKEFARGNKLDQIDLIHFASLMQTEEGNALVDTLTSAIKYNRTSSGLANAYGLSIYFPYTSFRGVRSAASIFNSIGMSAEYALCIQKFAQGESAGQAVTGGGSTPWYSLYGSDSGSYSGSSGGGDYSNSYELSGEEMLEILGLLLGGRGPEIARLHLDGLTEDNCGFLTEGEPDAEALLEMVSADRIRDEDLRWTENAAGEKVLKLTGAQWGLITRVDKALYYQDDQGYIDMGLDNAYDWDDEGNLVPETGAYSLAVNGQPVAYYHTETYDNGDEDYRIAGTIPVLLNGDRADLIVVFDSENEDGFIAGAVYRYADSDAVGKNLSGLKAGDQIDFLAGCYRKDGTFEDNYKIGDQPLTVEDPADIRISDVELGGKVLIAYCLTDIYGQQFWTEAIGE